MATMKQFRRRPAAGLSGRTRRGEPRSVEVRDGAAGLRELAELVERSGDVVIQTDANGAIIYMNPTARSLLGLSGDAALPALTFEQFAGCESGQQFKDVIRPKLEATGVWLGETCVHLQQGRELPFSHMVIAHRDRLGRIVRVSSVLRDMSVELEARSQIQRQADILRAITEAIPATVVIVDRDVRYRFVNKAFEQYCGRSANEIIGRRSTEVLGVEEVARRTPYMLRAFAGEAVSFTLDYPGPNGKEWRSMQCIPLKLNGMVDGMVGISQDATAQHREEQRLTHLAQRDPLTGLLNRTGLEHGVSEWIDGGHGTKVAMLYIDLDHFKPVNDRHGHLMGDRLLQAFGQRLTDSVRRSDLVARLGGDEFAIALLGVPDLRTAREVGEKVLTAARTSFEIDGQTLHIGASVGAALSDDAGADWRRLLAEADGQLYIAKELGRGRLSIAAA
jgi:diguanylate cyclase (GGDEF)-like protein/PAS domain S-box-containing protein